MTIMQLTALLEVALKLDEDATIVFMSPGNDESETKTIPMKGKLQVNCFGWETVEKANSNTSAYSVYNELKFYTVDCEKLQFKTKLRTYKLKSAGLHFTYGKTSVSPKHVTVQVFCK